MSPTVCCVMLVNGRREMTRRAIASFRAQTYEAKLLVIVDSGEDFPCPWLVGDGVFVHCVGPGYYRTIGSLRNFANTAAGAHGCDLISHFDSDDWSHPRRLEEQVALLQASGKQCVGYRELLFWDTRTGGDLGMALNEAWIYRNHDPRWCAGASMLYTREAWEACPFDDAPHKDQRWWLKNAEKCLGVSAQLQQVTEYDVYGSGSSKPCDVVPCEPRMICQMHAGGTEQIPREVMLLGDVWARASEFDVFCKGVMQL